MHVIEHKYWYKQVVQLQNYDDKKVESIVNEQQL